MNKQAHVIFQGRVQGVCFRAYTKEQAVATGLTGWVRNLPYGSVEALFEGEETQVRDTIEKCRQGPPSARVEKVDIDWENADGEFPGFKIRY